MHAIRQRFNLYAGGSSSADVRRFFQLINADEVLGTHRGLFQMAVDMRPLTREELVRSLPRELERLARSLLGRLRTERPPLGAPPSSSHRSMDLALSFGVSGGSGGRVTAANLSRRKHAGEIDYFCLVGRARRFCKVVLTGQTKYRLRISWTRSLKSRTTAATTGSIEKDLTVRSTACSTLTVFDDPSCG